jgi:PAS domain S-box-containing protein
MLQKYEALLANIDGIVWEADPRSFRFTFVSPQAERLLGYPLARWFEPDFWATHLHPDDRTRAVDLCTEATREKRKHALEYRMIAADGRAVWLHDTVNVLVDGDEATGLCGVMVDVTGRKRTEEALRESAELYRLLTENSNDLIYLLDLEGQIVYTSPSVGRLLGRVPRSNFEVVHPDDLGSARACWERVLAGHTDLLTVRARDAQGEWHWLEALNALVHYHGRSHVLSVCRDVSARKRAEEATRDTERQLRTLIENYPDFIVRFDRACRHRYVSPAVARAFGVPADRFVGRTLGELAVNDPPGQNEALEAGIRRAFAEGLPNALEAHWVTRDGERVFEVRHIPEHDESGRVVSVLGVTRDITERRRAEDALRTNHNLLSAVFEATPDIVFVKDLRGRVLMINSAGARLLGKGADEILGRDDTALHEPEDARRIMERDRHVMASGAAETFEEAVTVRGEARTYLTTKDVYRDARGAVAGLLGTARDVTERRRAEEALRASELRFRTFVDHATDAFFLHDERGTVLDVNEQACASLGYPREELIRMTPYQFDADLAPAVLDQFEARLAAGEVFAFDTRHRRRDGTTFPVEVRVRSFWHGGRRFGVSLARDITERKRAEEQLRASLQEKVVLLKEVHHRVKNNLQLVSSLLALQAGALKDRAVKEALTQSQNRVRAMALVHENLYRSGDLSSVRIAPHIESLCWHLWRSYGVDPDRIGLTARVADLTLDLDRALRCGLIVNELVSNALKHAFPAGRRGRVTVKLDHAPDGWYALVVADDGVGLPPGVDPDRTDTLGLQLVGDLTAQLNGTLALARDGGTTFTVRVPPAPP